MWPDAPLSWSGTTRFMKAPVKVPQKTGSQKTGSGLNTVRLDAKSVRAELVEALSPCNHTLRQAQGERLNEQYWVRSFNIALRYKNKLQGNKQVREQLSIEKHLAKSPHLFGICLEHLTDPLEHKQALLFGRFDRIGWNAEPCNAAIQCIVFVLWKKLPIAL